MGRHEDPARLATAASADGLSVERLDPAGYAADTALYARLDANALWPTPHLAPCCVAAAIARLGGPGSVVLLLARAGETPAGLWALRRTRSPRTGFVGALEAPLLPLYETTSAPLLDRDLAQAAWAALLSHVAGSPDLPGLIRAPLLPDDPALALPAGMTTRCYENWRRPLALRGAEPVAAYLRRAFGPRAKKRLAEHRALRRAGALTLSEHRGTETPAALADFLALESAGWKGRAGTALACLPADAAYIGAVVAGLAARDAVRVTRLALDGRTIAMGLLLEGADGAVFLKIAFDEAFARHSPGRALAIAMLDSADGERRLDSGAGDAVDPKVWPWAEHQPMAHRLIATRGAMPALPALADDLRMRLRAWRARRVAPR